MIFIIICLIIALVYFSLDIAIYRNPDSIIICYTNYKGERKEIIISKDKYGRQRIYNYI